MYNQSMTLFSLANFPMIGPGDDLASVILQTLASMKEALQPNDVIVIAQKIVSKSEGRLVRLGDVSPSEKAIQLAEETGKDARVIQIILDDSTEIIRVRPGLLIAEQTAGWICANAGVDRSNIEADSLSGETTSNDVSHDNDVLALLPLDADESARRIRQRLAELMDVSLDDAPAIIINDSHGRAWRIGTVGISIGCAGFPALWDQRGLRDLFGYELMGSEECLADELAAAASLLMGQSSEGTPVVIVRGFCRPSTVQNAPARSLQRPKEMDAFR